MHLMNTTGGLPFRGVWFAVVREGPNHTRTRTSLTTELLPRCANSGHSEDWCSIERNAS